MKTVENIQKSFEQVEFASLKSCEEKQDEIILSCNFIFSQDISDQTLTVDKKIKICVYKDYPIRLPKVYEDGEKTIKHYRHIYNDENNTFCLGTDFDIYERLAPLYKFDMFLSIIAWFLVDEAYYSIHRDFPMGDRSHFQVGIKETYFEYFSVNSLHDLQIVVEHLYNTGNRMNNKLCYCGSGRKFKNCHKGKFDRILNNAYLKRVFNEDLERLGVTQ